MYKLITPATIDPVSVTELKEDIGIYHTEKDNILLMNIKSATDYAERHTGRQLLPATWELHLDVFTEFVCLKKCPVTSVTSIKYFDVNNTEQTLVADTDYFVDLTEPAIVQFANVLMVYPRPDAIKIRFASGYANAAAVPSLIKKSIILMAGSLYQNPVDSVENLPKASTNLLRQYRV